MKKITLKNLAIDEVLTKDDLKKIVGGNGSGCQYWICYCPDQSPWPTTTCSQTEVDYMFSQIYNNDFCPGRGNCYLI